MMKEELKLAAANLKKLPGFSITVVLTLALTLAALCVVININHRLLTKPLPYPNADTLWVTDQSETINGETQYGFQMLPTQLLIYQDQQFIEQMAMLHHTTPRLMDVDNRPTVDVLRVSPEFFSLLGVPMHLGRALNANEGVSDEQKVLVLSYQAWQDNFNADPKVVGSFTQLNRVAYQIIGVTAAEFEVPEIFRSFAISGFSSFPEALSTTNNWNRISSQFNGIARLKPGVNPEQANHALGEQINALYQSQENVAPDTAIGARFTPLRSRIIAESDSLALSLLFSAAVLVLIALTNVTNLFLSRGAQKQRTMAIQAALGAKPRHIFVSMFCECALLIGAATVLGLLAAQWLNVLLAEDLSYLFTRMQALSLDAPTIVIALVLALLITLLIAAITSSQVNYQALTDALHASGKGTGAQISARTRHILVALQVMFASLLLFLAANKLLPAYQEMTHPTGFDTEHLYYVRVDGSATDIAPFELARQVKNTLSAQAGINSVAASATSPLVMGWKNYLYDENIALLGIISLAFIDEDAFTTLALPLRQGRSFSPIAASGEDNNEIVLSESLAKRLYGETSPLGQTLYIDQQTPRKVVGVVGDVYVPTGPLGYELERYYVPLNEGSSAFIIKASGPLAQAQLSEVLKDIHPTLNFSAFRKVDDMLSQRLRQTWLQAMLTVALLTLTLSLAGAGIYGVLSYSVQMRRYELGIHLSLGAHTHKLTAMIVKQSFVPILTGLAVSLLFATLGYLLWSRVGEGPVEVNWLAVLSSIPVMLLVAFIASYLPVQKVIRQDPIRALRNE
ncbi:ABC transporter permease [Pseudoalteromonas sp. DL2-H2.2]|uniref:ABC transporter permease n=1 Tax=Pseudoalteromonas sp. DL2-H2.2 TaxID=2908889 RepID=UPI001F2C5BA6|nr:ABC transporter permease [Pseudoalteromonas sp. DL2-H2.2]MCF2909877.1 ABC transporter permease [Pseudoalteromonas sp. DL2-H2.2]